MQRILLADADTSLLEKIQRAPGSENYTFEIAEHGEDVLDKIDLFKPHLLYLDLLLPGMHGIEVLKKIRENAELQKLGIILASANSMIQNFHAAIKEGANFFLPKPFDFSFLFTLFSRFFEGTLKPDSFDMNPPIQDAQTAPYHPTHHDPHSFIKFWGTRGSNPVSWPEYIRFGGNTVCLEVRHKDDLAGQNILDRNRQNAGTSLRHARYLAEIQFQVRALLDAV